MNFEEQINNEKIQLDEKSQDDIFASEFDTDIEKLSSKLGGYQLNSQKRKHG